MKKLLERPVVNMIPIEQNDIVHTSAGNDCLDEMDIIFQ